MDTAHCGILMTHTHTHTRYVCVQKSECLANIRGSQRKHLLTYDRSLVRTHSHAHSWQRSRRSRPQPRAHEHRRGGPRVHGDVRLPGETSCCLRLGGERRGGGVCGGGALQGASANHRWTFITRLENGERKEAVWGGRAKRGRTRRGGGEGWGGLK